MDNDYEPPRQRKKPKVKESIIDHTYRDYSQVEVSSDDEGGSVTDDKKQSRLQPNFPAKLHAIVSNPNYQHIVCWQAHGRSWKIVDKHLLSTVICPKHFAHAKFESFNRSVNGWGFKRLLNPGPDCKSYYHECFLRGRPELTKLMQRLVNPGKRLPDKAGEPDFYEISRKYPLPAAPTTALQEELTPAALSPHSQRPSQQSRFTFPPNQPGGYPYGYYPAPYPQLPSPASSYAGQQPYPPQPPQQGFYQMPPGLYPPNPAAYGYYPYPQMMVPQGYEQYPHPSMYGQYYPGGPVTPTAYTTGSPGRQKTAAQGRPPPVDEQGQYYQSPGAQPDSSATSDADPDDERKPSAITGVKRPLESLQGDPADSSCPSEPPPHAAGTSAKDGHNSSEQSNIGVMSGALAKASSEGSNAAPERRLTKPEEGGGDGIHEQQLLQDFFQHF
ncbi:hypothetical protein ACHAXA_002516 [Cyclostephanos tholiformis]|uniref:HSF-type DNA-binding domain-containing protein n=1 Tax=Cyclostephanos tholiformis TaxID=382380 RepID=A0ABD3SDN7_9STRA